MATAAAAECPVCCAAFTPVLRRNVQCNYCDFGACAACVAQYLLQSPKDADCMSCRKPWNREFLDDNFTKAFVSGAYKQHREHVLLDREKALLPESQILLENYKIADNLMDNVRKNEIEVARLRGRLEAISRDIHHDRSRHARITAANYTNDGGLGAGRRERRACIRGCPVDECRGFLSTAWKCGTCEVQVCPQCHEVKSTDATDHHVCDADAVASARLMARDTKACPSCAALIFKIDGCDQMWCTQCHTAFSWRTGEVVTTTVHNPHYYEYLRRTVGEVPRNPGDIVPGEAEAAGACGRLPNPYEFERRIRGLPTVVRRFLSDTHRTARHFTDIDIRRLRGETEYDANVNADLRLQYLLKRIDETEWRRKLQQREKRRQRDMEIRQILEMFVAATADTTQKITDSDPFVTDYVAFGVVRELVNLMTYADEQITLISKRFNMSVNYWRRFAYPPGLADAVAAGPAAPNINPA